MAASRDERALELLARCLNTIREGGSLFDVEEHLIEQIEDCLVDNGYDIDEDDRWAPAENE